MPANNNSSKNCLLQLVSESLRINSVKLACVSLKPFCIKHCVRMEIEQQVGSQMYPSAMVGIPCGCPIIMSLENTASSHKRWERNIASLGQ